MVSGPTPRCSFEPIAVGHCSGHGSDYIEVETDVPANPFGRLARWAIATTSRTSTRSTVAVKMMS